MDVTKNFGIALKKLLPDAIPLHISVSTHTDKASIPTFAVYESGNDIFVCARGTASIGDILTDFDFNVEEENVCGEVCRIHGGMLRSARAIIKVLE